MWPIRIWNVDAVWKTGDGFYTPWVRRCKRGNESVSLGECKLLCRGTLRGERLRRARDQRQTLNVLESGSRDGVKHQPGVAACVSEEKASTAAVENSPDFSD